MYSAANDASQMNRPSPRGVTLRGVRFLKSVLDPVSLPLSVAIVRRIRGVARSGLLRHRAFYFSLVLPLLNHADPRLHTPLNRIRLKLMVTAQLVVHDVENRHGLWV